MNDEKSQYEKDEDVLIDCVEGMLEYYNMNLEEIFSVIKDRIN